MIYNWDGLASVAVDLHLVLAKGQRFEIRDAQNYYGEPVLRGEYQGLPVAVPMNAVSVSRPIGEVPVPPVHTSNEFGVFVVLTT